jgi:hypothetical protein
MTMIQKYRRHQKSTFRLKMSICSLFICLSIITLQPGAYAAEEYLLLDPVISNAGGNISLDDLNMGIFVGLPFGDYHLDIPPNYQTIMGSGFVLWEHMLRSISGQVVNEKGEGIPNVTIDIRKTYSDDHRLVIYAQTKTDADGHYIITRLPARDDLTLYAEPADTFVSQFYHDKESFELADAISTLPGNLEQVNLTLHEPPQNGISGQVFDDMGAGISDITVLLSSESLEKKQTTQTDTNGLYRFRGVSPASDYRIGIWSDTYQTFVYYKTENSSVTNPNQASLITVADKLIPDIHVIVHPDNLLYYIAATAGENGRISPSGQVAVPYQGSQTFVFIPDEGAIISNVIIDDVAYGPILSYTLTMVQHQGHTISVEFDFPRIQVSAGPNGRIQPDGLIQVNAGENQRFAITPENGYEIQDVFIDGISVGPKDTITLTNIQKHHTIEATFKARNSVDINISFENSTIIIQNSNNAPITLTSDQSPYTLSVNQSDTLLLTIQPENTHYISDILINENPHNINETIVLSDIQEAQDIQISFLPIVIQANVQGKGTISPSGTIPLEKGQNQTFSMIPDMGYFIDQLIIDGEAVSPQDTFTFWDIHKAHTIDVTFEAQDPITLTVTVDEGGSITVSDYRRTAIKSAVGPETYTVQTIPDSQIILSIGPSEGYRLSDVVINGQSRGVQTEMMLNIIQSPLDISCSFERLPVHTITIIEPENGSITPSGLIHCLQGDHTAFTIQPDPGFHVINVLLNDDPLGPLSQYIFNPDGLTDQSYSLRAFFEPDVIRTLSGKIRFESTPIENAIVYLSFSEKLYTTTSDENGDYSFTHLPALSQGQLWVDPGDHYTKEYLSDNISINDSDLTGMDIDVQRIYQGKIKGRIHFSAMADKNPGMLVQAISDSDRDYLIATTDANGFYTFTQMVPGAYIVVVQDRDMNTDYYFSESGTVVSALNADYITLGIDATSDAVDITLTPGGIIRGMVYQSHPTDTIPLNNILVTARSIDNEGSQSTLTDEQGAFTITGLSFISEHDNYTQTGYIVEVPPLNYQYQAYPQASQPKDAQAVYTGIDQINFYLKPYATISGQITGPPFASIDIITRSLSTPGFFAETQVILSENGSSAYSLSGLISSDDYVITAYPEHYPSMTYSQLIDLSYGNQTDIHLVIEPGTQLIGSITDDTDNSIANAVIQLFLNNALYRETTSDETGNYTITGLLNETYSIQIDHPNRLAFKQEVNISEPEIQRYNIQLKTGFVASGQITYNENPVPGIVIEAMNQITYRQTTVNEEGTYTLTGLLPGHYTITITGETYEPINQTIIIEDQDVRQDYTINKSYRHVSGYIYKMHKNETARIRAWSANGSDKTLNVKATHENEPVYFKISGLMASDDYIIEVKSTEHPLHFYNDKFGLKKADHLNLIAENVENLQFSLVQPLVIEGTVNVPAFPMGVIETSVLVHATAEYYGSEGIATLDFINPGEQDFTITLLINSDDYLVSVQSEHFMNHFFNNVQKEISATPIDTMAPVPIYFTMTGGASISGTIVDNEGHPKEDILVLAWSLKTGSQGSTRTNENGKFIVMGLVQSDDFLVQTWNADNVTFFYNTDQTVRSQKQAHYLSTMVSNVTGISLSILTVEKLTGRITDNKNKPIAGVMVTAESEITMSDGSTFTDKNGTYVIDSLLSGNDYVVKTVHDKWISQEKYDVATDSVVDFKLDHQPVYKIYGRIVDQSNTVVPRSKVEIWSETKRDYVGKAILTDSEGVYELIVDSPGIYKISVTPPSDANAAFASQFVSIDSDINVPDIILPMAYYMSGTVLYTDQVPVVNATVILRSSYYQYVKQTQTDELGRYRFSNIPNSSDYQITVIPVLGVGKEKNELFPGSDVDFTLFRSSFIEGTITDKSTGQPIKQAIVEVYSKSKPDILGFSEFTYSDDEGQYRFNSLRVNDDNGNRVLDYAITVFASDYLIDLKSMRKTGDTVNIELEKDTKGIRKLSGEVTSQGNYDFFIVMLMKEGTKFERFAKTNPDGSFTFDKLNPNKAYGFTITPYIDDMPLSTYTVEQLYHTGGHVELTYQPGLIRKRLSLREILRGNIISLKSLTHLIDVVSNLHKITFNWDFNGLYDDLSGYYTLLNTHPTHTFTILNSTGDSPVVQRVYTSQEIDTEYDTYYFHIAPVYTDGIIGETTTIGPYPIDTRAPFNINVMLPEVATSLQIPIQLAVTGAYEMYISPYNFGEGGSWEPWQPDTMWMLFDVPDTQYLYIQFRDRAGNIANTVAETIYRERITYTIRTDKFGMGYVDPADALTGEIQVDEGSDQTVTITPNPGFEIYQISVDGASVDLINNTYTFENIQSDHDLVVRFRNNQHTIAISSSPGGWISPCILENQCDSSQAFSGQIDMDSGTDLTLTVVADEGFEIKSMIVDGVPVSITHSVYTFEQIEIDHTFNVAFSQIKTSPVISDIPNMRIDENTINQAFVIQIMDAETDAGDLMVEFMSDNQALISQDNIILINSQGNERTYGITPKPNQFGVATITAKVTDSDQMTALKTFNVQVNNVYYPPQIGDIKDQEINQNSISGPHSLTISSQDTDLLTVKAESSNTILMPVDRIYFSYDEQHGQSPFTISVIGGQVYPILFTLEPVSGKSGSALITITVENQHAQSQSQYLTLTVLKQDHAPELSFIDNQIIEENSSTGKIPFTISDPDGGHLTLTAQSLSPFLVKDTNIVFYDGVQNYPSMLSMMLDPDVVKTLYLQVTPETNQWGACNIKINATDGAHLNDSSTFVLSVNQYIPPLKTYYGFIYDEYYMGINDVTISLVQPEIQGYSTVTDTQLGTGPNGQKGNGYYAFQLPKNDEIYYFTAEKPGYQSVSFNTRPEYVEDDSETEIFFKPLYLSNCNDNQFIAGTIEKETTHIVDLFLIANSTLITSKKVSNDQFSFCVSNAIFDSYTIIASTPDYYTAIGLRPPDFPVININIPLQPVIKTIPIKEINGSTTIIKRTITVNPIGGQIIIINENQGTEEIGSIGIPVLKNECINDDLSLAYQIISDAHFRNNDYTNGSDETIIQTNLKSQCDHIEMVMEIPIDYHVSLNDFITNDYQIYAAASQSDLLNGKYSYIVDPSDIISVAGGKVKYRTEDSAVFGVGKGVETCVECESCIDCDTKPTTLCFVGSISHGEGVGIWFWGDAAVGLYIFQFIDSYIKTSHEIVKHYQKIKEFK